MRNAIVLAAGVLVLLFVNYGIYQREQLLTDGRIVLLELSPVDPRSLMQGDYMRLNFAAADQAFPSSTALLDDGHLVVALDNRGVGRFRRFADGKPLARDEVALRYRVRGGRPNFATNGFFFEEGQAEALENAAFGEFRVGPDGEMILTGLRGRRFQPLRASKN
jgi:uncharacterized membrane-anchored protein